MMSKDEGQDSSLNGTGVCVLNADVFVAVLCDAVRIDGGCGACAGARAAATVLPLRAAW